MSAPLLKLFAAGVAAVTLAAPARGAAHQTTWACWLQGGTDAACMVLEAADRVEPWASAPARRAAPASPAQLLHDVRMRPSSLKGRLVIVPLFDVPFESSRVDELVTAVLCGGRPDCAAHYHASLPQLVAQAPELFADMNDPVLDDR